MRTPSCQVDTSYSMASYLVDNNDILYLRMFPTLSGFDAEKKSISERYLNQDFCNNLNISTVWENRRPLYGYTRSLRAERNDRCLDQKWQIQNLIGDMHYFCRLPVTRYIKLKWPFTFWKGFPLDGKSRTLLNSCMRCGTLQRDKNLRKPGKWNWKTP